MTRHLLLSARTAADLRERILEAARGHALEVVTLEEAAADDSLRVHAAFISRDVTGLSTKQLVQEPLAGCYRVLRRSNALAWLHTHSAGIDRPIYGELAARCVVVSTSAGANADVVAQSALGAVLALARRLPQLARAQAQRRWAPLTEQPPPDLVGQTVVLVGWGSIAQRLQPWLAMLGLRTIVVRHRPEPAGPGLETVRYTDLKAVLSQAQWLVLACPLSDATRHLVDAQALACLPPTAMLVNVARGEVIDEAALTAALQAARLGGAYLDVFEREPLVADSPLWDMANVIVTPHAAGMAAGNPARTAAIFLDNLCRWLRDEPLRNSA